MRPKAELIVIGGPAGSLEVILHMLSGLKPALPLPVIIVMHRKSDSGSALTELLSSKSGSTVKEAEEKEAIRPGVIYIAPPDYHLLIENDRTFSLDYSEKINFSRPCIDLTFQTAAEVYGNILACLLLSGASADGVEGLELAQACGGIIAVQNPETAIVSFMPQKALEKIKADYVLDVNEVANFIHLMAYPDTTT